jgi:hypothetical protein
MPFQQNGSPTGRHPAQPAAPRRLGDRLGGMVRRNAAQARPVRIRVSPTQDRLVHGLKVMHEDPRRHARSSSTTRSGGPQRDRALDVPAAEAASCPAEKSFAPIRQEYRGRHRKLLECRLLNDHLLCFTRAGRRHRDNCEHETRRTGPKHGTLPPTWSLSLGSPSPHRGDRGLHCGTPLANVHLHVAVVHGVWLRPPGRLVAGLGHPPFEAPFPVTQLAHRAARGREPEIRLRRLDARPDLFSREQAGGGERLPLCRLVLSQGSQLR